MQQKQRTNANTLRLDSTNACVWRGKQAYHLTPKTFAVLSYLVQQPGQLATKEELLTHGWPDVSVGEAVLTVSIREIRAALGDDPQTPRFIETIHRRGYRFIGQLQDTVPQRTRRLPRAPVQHPHLIGRARELAMLHQSFTIAQRGTRQVVFVTGEAGIGKTTLIETFLIPAALPSPLRIARGQCIEHSGSGMAYHPILQALDRVCRSADGERFIRALRTHAPTWLVQMPTLMTDKDLCEAKRRAEGANQERLFRELATALEALTRETLLVLWLEDLHWSDGSTIGLLSYLARRHEPAKLLILSAYRPVDVIMHKHPLRDLKHELTLHDQCVEAPLNFWEVEDIVAYLNQRFGDGSQLPVWDLARILHKRSAGNPLFIAKVLDYVSTLGVLTKGAEQWRLAVPPKELARIVPPSLRELLLTQVKRLAPAERVVLEAASVIGEAFAVEGIAAAVQMEADHVEHYCDTLRQNTTVVQQGGEEDWTDGTQSEQYRFCHSLYRQVLYEQISPDTRRLLHKRIGEWQERVCGANTDDVTEELAEHFARARNYQQAIKYQIKAGKHALRQHAHQEALQHFDQSLAFLKHLPHTQERVQLELTILAAFSVPLIMLKGYTAQAVEQVCVRVRELCCQTEDKPEIFLPLYGLVRFFAMRGDLLGAQEIAQRLRKTANGADDRTLQMLAHNVWAAVLMHLGDLSSSLIEADQSVALYDADEHHALILTYGDDPQLMSLCHAAWLLWLHGYPTQARTKMKTLLSCARERDHPMSLTATLCSAATLHQFCREANSVYQCANEAIKIADAGGFSLWLQWNLVLREWARAEAGHIGEKGALIRQSLAEIKNMGATLWWPYYSALTADTCGKMGQVETGLQLINEALTMMSKTGERFYESELHRLRGDFTLLNGQECRRGLSVQKEAEAALEQARQIARQQKARSLELRATMSLARLWRRQGKTREAKQQLADIYHWFTEGFDTKDLCEANALLETL